MAAGEHTPTRPSWTCSDCGEDWPCDKARGQLGQEYGEHRVNLAVYMATQLGHAAGELSGVSTTELYQRFIAWTRP
ncbi:flavin reductase [Phytohabitans kaempferiae]|uniref:Flavin reductase n=1 Tax=Phytohabitans kaempferiae TaxID=1620943 RepID=A0ABV6LUY1_9ACTN